MFIRCKSCKIVYCEDDEKISRFGNGDIKFHCDNCGNDMFEVAL